MSKPMIKIVNASTGEEIEREMNAAEIAQMEKDKIAFNLAKQQELKQQEARTALLAKLGITEEEAKLLLGGN
jgi:hypothetical protein